MFRFVTTESFDFALLCSAEGFRSTKTEKTSTLQNETIRNLFEWILHSFCVSKNRKR